MFTRHSRPMTEAHNHHTVARDDLLFSVEMALRKTSYLWPKRRPPGDHDHPRIELMYVKSVRWHYQMVSHAWSLLVDRCST